METLPKLKYLSLYDCRKITSLPQLAQVETLIFSDCVNLGSLLELHVEEAWETYSVTICLLELWLDNCNNVQALSEQLSHFTKLTYLDLSRNNFVTLPSSITELSSLETLYLNNCKNLISVEELPQSVKYLYAHGCDSLEKVSLSPNHSIKHLDLIHCPRLNQEEHEHLMDLFIHDDGHSQEGSRLCASCLRKTEESSNSGTLPETGGSSNSGKLPETVESSNTGSLPETGGRSNSDNETSQASKKLRRTGNFFQFLKSYLVCASRKKRVT